MTTQPVLHTARLRLEPLTDAHLHLEVILDSDPEVMRHLTGRASSRAEVEQAHRRRIAAGRRVPGLGFWVGFAAETFIGWWILQPPYGPDQPQLPGEADLGYRLLRSQWRQGYATEGARELVRYGFDELRLDRIFAQTMTVNAASRATMAAAGLRYRRTFTSAAPPEELVVGREQGEVEYDIVRRSWSHGPTTLAGASRCARPLSEVLSTVPTGATSCPPTPSSAQPPPSPGRSD